MRSQSLTGLLLYEAKRRPEIQLLVDRITELTDQEIQQATVPLDWFKQALRYMRDNERAKKMVIGCIAGVVPDPLGSVGYWNFPDAFITVSSKSSLEVKTGYPLWFPDNGGVWIDTVYCQSIPHQLLPVLRETAMRKTEYKILLRSRLNRTS